MYNIDFSKLIQYFTPWFMRNSTMTKWLFSLLKPLDSLNVNVVRFWRARMEKFLSYDGMTVHLERYLNAEYYNPSPYDPNIRNQQISNADIIYIETTANNALRYVYNKAENNPPIYLYNDAESAAPEYFYNLSEQGTFPSFTVWVPTSLGGTYEVNGTQDNITLKGRVNTFRLAGYNNYLIKRY